MKTSLKNSLMALTLVSAIGGSLAFAQSNTPSVVTTPPPGTRMTPPAATLRGAGPMESARGPLATERQPRMREASRALELARLALQAAEPDKGGFREKAIASVEQAIKDVQAGIAYADAHPEEFPGAARGPRGGARGMRGTAAGSAGSGAPAATQ